jgi:hypothetical protein
MSKPKKVGGAHGKSNGDHHHHGHGGIGISKTKGGEVSTDLFPYNPQLSVESYQAWLQIRNAPKATQPSSSASSSSSSPSATSTIAAANLVGVGGVGGQPQPKRDASYSLHNNNNQHHHAATTPHGHSHGYGVGHGHGHHHQSSVSVGHQAHAGHAGHAATVAGGGHHHSSSLVPQGHLSPHPPAGPPPPLPAAPPIGAIKVPRAHSVGSATAANPPGRPQSAGTLHSRQQSQSPPAAAASATSPTGIGNGNGTTSPNGSSSGKFGGKKKIGYPSAPGPLNIRELIPVDLPAARSERSRSSPGPQPDPDVFTDFPITMDEVMNAPASPQPGAPPSQQLQQLLTQQSTSPMPVGAVQAVMPAPLAAALTLPPGPIGGVSISSSMEPPRPRPPYVPPGHGHGHGHRTGGMVHSMSDEDMDLWASFDMQFRTPAPLSQTMSPAAAAAAARAAMHPGHPGMPAHSPSLGNRPFSMPVGGGGLPPHSPSGDFTEFMHMRGHSLSLDSRHAPPSPSPSPPPDLSHPQLPSMMMLAGGHPPLAPNGYHNHPMGGMYGPQPPGGSVGSPHYPQPSYEGNGHSSYMGNAFGPRVAAPLSHGGMNGAQGMMAVVPYMGGGIPGMHSGGSTAQAPGSVRAPLTGTVGNQPGAPPVVAAEMLDLGPRGPRGDEPKPKPLPPQPPTPPSPQPGAASSSTASSTSPSVRPPPPAYTPDVAPLSVMPLGNGGSAPTSGFDDDHTGAMLPPGSTTSAAPATAIRTADLPGAGHPATTTTPPPASIAPKSDDEIEFQEVHLHLSFV